MSRWKHYPVTSKKRGMLLVQCCGQCSGWVSDVDAASWYTKHTGLIEKKKEEEKDE